MKTNLKFLLLAAFCASITLPAFGADPKKVIVVTVTTGFRHSSIETAEKVLQQIADQSKAFTIVDFVRQPQGEPKGPKKLKEDASAEEKAKFEADSKAFNSAKAEWSAKIGEALKKLSPENLKNIDGVIFANTTGDLPLPDKEGFMKWIEAGHAFIGMHSASDTFHGFPAFTEMVGGEFKSHGAQVGVDLLKLDKNHPATRGLPDVWTLNQEEMYLFKNYDRSRVHDLWAIDKEPNTKAAGHYPVSWTRTAGSGRVFYTSLGHREDIWDADPNLKDRKNPPEIAKQFQQHILGGIKWALGLEGAASSQPK